MTYQRTIEQSVNVRTVQLLLKENDPLRKESGSKTLKIVDDGCPEAEMCDKMVLLDRTYVLQAGQLDEHFLKSPPALEMAALGETAQFFRTASRALSSLSRATTFATAEQRRTDTDECTHATNGTQTAIVDWTPGVCAVKGCGKAAYTKDHISWCREHVKKMMQPIQNDFEKELRKWPESLRRKIAQFELIPLTADETQYLLYSTITAKLQRLEQSLSKSEQVNGCRDLLKAIASYRARFNPEPLAATELCKLAVSFILALVEKCGAAVVFCSAAALAIPVALVAVGIHRKDNFFEILGFSGLVGFGIGLAFGGPVGALAGASIATGVAGLVMKFSSEEKEK